MRSLLALLLLFSAACYGNSKQSLSVEESLVLKEFFQVLIGESEGGYVIFDKKPLCIHGYQAKDSFSVNSPIYKQSVAIREGARLWKQLEKKNSDLILHIYDKEDPYIPGTLHVLVINVPLFHRAINQQLSLFQYVLGPAVTSAKLLSAITSPTGSFHSLLKNDKVLVGEILGFGIENALCVSRVENLLEASDRTIPPFLNSHQLRRQYDNEYLPVDSSFGFKNVDDELNIFQDKIILSSEKLKRKNPEFIFGWLKDSKTSKEFVLDLERTQEKIRTYLSSHKFLETTLEFFTDSKPNIDTTKKMLPIDEQTINQVVARGLWESLQNYDHDSLPYFIEGLAKTNSSNVKTERLAWFPDYRRELHAAKVNLKESNQLFDSLHHDRNFQCIADRQLYHRIIKPGSGTTECSSTLASVDYSIFSPIGHCLASAQNVTLNLKNVVPGFAHGIQGMKIGETREIFIHPSVAYGFETSLEKCSYLRAIVTLHDFQETSASISPLTTIDLTFVSDPKTTEFRDESYKNALIEKAREIAAHLKKCKEINLPTICNQLKQFHTGKDRFIPTTQTDQDAINHVHWNIYYGSSAL